MENFHKYLKIKILGNEENEGILDGELVITEKMDGANTRTMFKDDNIIFGSRTQQLTSDEGEESNVPKNFIRGLEFVRDKTQGKKLDGSYILYMECMVKHTMGYDWEHIPPMLGFDIMDLSTGKYLDYDKQIEIFKKLDLPTVPLIWRGDAKDFPKFLDGKEIEDCIGISAYPSPSAKDQLAEGWVIKNYGKQLFAKIVRSKFKEKNKEVFGDSKKWARQESDEALLVATYCTNPRIDKIIFKLIDEGEKLDLPMMAKLPKMVISDIYEENWKEILNSNWTLNLKEVRKKINKRCLAALQQSIVNNALFTEEKK